MFGSNKRYDVMYFDDGLDTEILWIRTPYFIEMIRAVIYLMSSCRCVAIRIRDVDKYIKNPWGK